MPEYLHQEPGTEVRFIAGHYTIVEEQRLVFCGREVLYVVGISVVGSTCCVTRAAGLSTSPAMSLPGRTGCRKAACP